ncbi:MAG: hypothetical protein K6G26_05575, partial [Lachnospiraceae bacterium]|nr:hypothetical protein [Lachnospiraceae bacterium]
MLFSEIKKGVSKKNIIIVFVLILISSCIFFQKYNTGDIKQHSSQKKELYNGLKTADYSTVKERIYGNANEEDDFVSSNVQNYEAEKHMNEVYCYNDKIKSIINRAYELLDVKVFKESQYATAVINKTIEIYSNVHTGYFTFEFSDGINNMISFKFADIIIITVIIMFAYNITNCDYDNGFTKVICTTKNGVNNLASKKILSMIWITFKIFIFTYLPILIMSIVIWGFGDVFRTIQSLENYYRCTYCINVLEFIIIYFLAKLAVFVIISLLAMIIAEKLRNIYFTYAVVSIFSILEYVLYSYINNNSLFSILKYANCYALIFPEKVIYNLTLINLFSKPVDAVLVELIFVLTFLFIMFILCLIAVRKHKNIIVKRKAFSLNKKIQIFKEKAENKFRINFSKKRLLNVEFYKMFAKSKTLIVLILVGILCLRVQKYHA